MRPSAAQAQAFDMRIAFAALALLTLANAEPSVRLGQTVNIGGPRVRADLVVEDSRCPMNARCVWAGRAVVRATVRTGRGARTMDLTLGQPVPVADGTLTLVSVSPERLAGKKLRLRDYRFAFRFDGGF